MRPSAATYQQAAFFDPATGTVTYVLSDPQSKRAAIIDSVLDYDPKSGCTSTASADKVLAYLHTQQLQLDWILETHAHADHVSAAQYLKAQGGGKIAMGENIRTVQATFKALFNLDEAFVPNGHHFDHLFKDGETFMVGGLPVTALLVPGHTPADMAYRVADAVFVGDTLFMPDVGTARADFPGGNAHTLYQSIQRLLALPAETQIFVCHDYPPDARQPRWQTTVREQRQHNIHAHQGMAEADFVAMRVARDATLEMPTLILPAIQINIRAGELPPAESNGVRYLKIPLNTLGKPNQA